MNQCDRLTGVVSHKCKFLYPLEVSRCVVGLLADSSVHFSNIFLLHCGNLRHSVVQRIRKRVNAVILNFRDHFSIISELTTPD